MTSPILSTLFLGALCAHGATVYSNYTPGDPATYDPTRPISIVSSTALFDPTGYGAYVPGVHTDVLTVSYPVPTGLPNGITSFAVPIRIVTPGTNSSISFSLYRGSLAY